MRQHPLSAVFPPLPLRHLFLLDGQAWRGKCAERAAILDVWPSESHKGYWDAQCSIVPTQSFIETKNPVHGTALGWLVEDIGDGPLESFSWEPFSRVCSSDSQEVTTAAIESADEFVYFMRAGEFVKIGKANSPETRKAELQTGCPYELEIIATVAGGIAQERAFHEKFSHLKARGEWFHLTTELKRFIKGLA